VGKKIRRVNSSLTQGEMRRGVDVGSAMKQVSPAMYWYKAQYFKNDDEAKGAFRLAYQQGLDGMGVSVAQWMGLSNAEFSAWMRDEALPKIPRRQ
jgi:hypothetical protein